MSPKKQDALALLVLILLALLMFWPVTLGGKTLLPADNLFAFEPWRSFASQWNATVPHNELLSDLILENYAWKRFIKESLSSGELPLWNPYLFAGVPFLAAGQHSALYPFSLLFMIVSLPQAYGWFSMLQMVLAGMAAYFFARVLRLNATGSLIAAITYMLSGFFVVSVVFSMVIAAVAWLPFLLACAELVVRRHEEALDGPARSPLPWILFGALGVGMLFLAGHVEIFIYSLMALALYAAWRLAILGWRSRSFPVVGRTLAALGGLVLLGIGLGGVQWVPLLELVTSSFRQGSASYADIIGWAYPNRQVVTFLIPDFFGNPSVHGYWDIVSHQWTPFTRNAMGEPIHTAFWGIKNYVEAGSYVGVMALLLAAVAIIQRGRHRMAGFFLALAMVSLLLAFGTPLYALLYYVVPGFKQLHSPFRWVFPYTLSVAMLAGMGASALGARASGALSARRDGVRWLGWGALAGGLTGLLVLLVSLFTPSPFITLSQWLVDRSETVRAAFPDGRAFYSYQFPHFLIFFLALAAGGAALLLARRSIRLPHRLGGGPLWKPLAIATLAFELLIIGVGFNPAVDASLLDFRPPVVDFLLAQQEDGPFRITTYNAPGEKTFNANVGMFYGLEDVRGYDSIIPQQYVEYMNAIAPQAGELLYNRIAPIYAPGIEALNSRLLDLLNVRFIITTHSIPNPGFKLVYDGEVRVYENLNVLPRAFFVADEEVLTREEVLRRLPHLEPTQHVLLERAPAEEDRAALASGRASVAYKPIDAIRSGINEVVVDVEVDGAGWLVLADSYFPGWKAYARPAGGTEDDEVERTIYRADGNFRAVRVDAGFHTIRFKYTPMSLKLGLFVTFLAAVMLFLLLAYYIWRKAYRDDDGEDAAVKRVAKNSLTPMMLSLVNKAIDFAFAMLRLRILDPAGEGRYTFAIVFIGYFQILTLFGLGTLSTREVSKDKSAANRYLSNTVILRGVLWLLSVPLMALVAFIYYRLGHLTADTAWAIVLFAIGLFFSNIADALSSIFYAHERMEFPAAVSTVINVFKVSLGAVVLIIGWGFVGLAGISVIGNLLTCGVLFFLLRRRFLRPKAEADLGFQRDMLRTSYPLMINHLLATVFFRVDMLLLKPMQGDAVVGYYSAAYKYVDGLTIIPAYFTQAIFPMMSRFAASARDSLMRAYVLSLRILLIISLPIAAATPFFADELILVLGGARYLPSAAIALRLLIWFLPFSFVNSVTQYVLIAIDEQRFLTKAFMLGVSFNLIANLIFIPRYGFQAAAVITVLSEWVLLLPFYYAVRRHLGHVPWLRISWQPALASAVMAGSLWLTRGVSPAIRLPMAMVIYLAVLIVSGGLSGEDLVLLRRMLPVNRFTRALDRLPGATRPIGE